MPEPRLRLLDRRRWPLLERRFSEASCTALPRRLRKGLPLKQGSGMPTPLRPSGFRMSRQTLPTDVIPRLARPTLMVTYQREMATLCLGSLGIHRKHYLCDGMAARPSTPPAARARGHRLADSRPRHNYRVLHSEFSAAQQCPITRGFGAAKGSVPIECPPMVTAQYQLVKLDNLRIASDHEAEVYSPPRTGNQPSDGTNYPETFSRSDRGTRVQTEVASL
jgi:hypothetical protein